MAAAITNVLHELRSNTSLTFKNSKCLELHHFSFHSVTTGDEMLRKGGGGGGGI